MASEEEKQVNRGMKQAFIMRFPTIMAFEGGRSENVKSGSLEIHGKGHFWKASISDMLDTCSSGQLRIGCLDAGPVSVFLLKGFGMLIGTAFYKLGGLFFVLQATAFI